MVPSWIKLLTDPELINERAERAIASDPERFEGVSAPSGAGVLSNLQQYLLNAFEDSTPRIIKGNNKRWLMSLGEPCAEVLTYLGFERQVSFSQPQVLHTDNNIPPKTGQALLPGQSKTLQLLNLYGTG